MVEYADLGSEVLRADQRIRAAVMETPLEPVSGLAPAHALNLLFKMENLQHTGSFKLRGATNKLLSLTPEQAGKGVIAASNGNHGLGVAAAAKGMGVAAEIYVSTQISSSKVKRIEGYGARVRKVGVNPLEAEIAGRAAAEQAGKVFISPYNDVEVIAGQGTIAVELQRQYSGIDAIFVAVGGGGLIGGIGSFAKTMAPWPEIIGCWPENSRVLYESLKAGRIVDFPEQPTLSESTAGALEPGSVTLEIAQEVIDRRVLVTEDEIGMAVRRVRDEKGWTIEGAAGVAVAAFLKTAEEYRGKTVVVLICGGNAASST